MIYRIYDGNHVIATCETAQSVATLYAWLLQESLGKLEIREEER